MRALVAGMVMLTVGCTTTDDEVIVDTGPRDMGVAVDTGPAPGLCPTFAASECTDQSACGELQPRQSNCEGCFAFTREVCDFGSCSAPPRLEIADTHNVAFAVGALEPQLTSFAQVALAAVTAGGETITCEGIYSGSVDLANGCYNLIDSRGRDITTVSNTYKLQFSRFPGGMRTLFVIWGHELAGAEGDPIGVTCTEYEVGSPGTGMVEVEGDMMRPIQ